MEPVEILPWLYLGDVEDSSSKSLLCHSFTALLNVSCIAIKEQLAHITYKHIKVADDAEADLKTWFPEAVAFIGGLLGIFNHRFKSNYIPFLHHYILDI